VRVAIVERDLLGGECSYWGCIPSKTLLRPGEAVAAARNAPGAREAVTGSVDVKAALGWRDFMVSGYDDAGQAAWARGAGIEVVRGRGALAGRGTVVVEGTSYTAEHIVVATGSDPAIPPVPGLRDLPGLWTDREVTGLTEVPARLLVLGGGPIGVEMAQAITRLGASVTVVERSDHLLPREPRALGDGVAAALRGDGVVLRLGSAPTAAG
jgi:pyruvate/2-oxoglutarate dehydrogenase complex dihydrolipoamide dehydrogenase (E3) component